MKTKYIRGIALGVLAAMIISTAGCGTSEGIRDTESAGEDISQEQIEGNIQESQNPEKRVTQEKQDSETQPDEKPSDVPDEVKDDDEMKLIESMENQVDSTEYNNENEEDKIMQNNEIEIFCPEEYTKRNTGVKYSDVIKTTYYSTTCEKDRPVNIVLPDGYSEDKEYPVLYVLHGIFGTQNDMNNNSITIQNMMTEGIAKDMIVVYPYMYASKTQDKCTAIDKENVAAYDNFINDLVTDLMPFIKENYSIAEGRENTAIAGFSMGGRETLAIGLQRPDLFGYVGAIAPAPGLVPGKDWAMEHEGQFTEEELVFNGEKPILLMVCCGDKDGTVGQFPKSYHDIFEKNGVEHVWWEIPGSDHGDPAISSGIYNFCRYIFQ